MRKITKEEAENLPIKGKGRASYLHSMILNMKPGDILVVEQGDISWKRGVSPLVRYIQRHHSKRRYTCKKIENGQGWLVTREK
ncbi:MAG: hypothetical protein AABZ32_09060 [Bacteroidota bacterium]